MNSWKILDTLLAVSGLVSLGLGIIAIVNGTLELVVVLFVVICALAIYFYKRRKEPYEFIVLNSQTDIYVETESGDIAKFRNMSLIKAKKDGVSKYKEDLGGDGIVDEITVEAGGVLNKVTIDGQDTYEISFGRTLEKDEEIFTQLNCVLKEFFTQDTEYWTIIEKHPTIKATLIIHFHSSRKYTDFVGLHKTGHYEIEATEKPREKTIDGASCLVWELDNPVLGDRYMLKWNW